MADEPLRPEGGVESEEVRTLVLRHARYSAAKPRRDLSPNDWFRVVAAAVRDELIERMLETEERYERADAKRLYYLSLEFLMGRALGNNLDNLRRSERYRAVLGELGVDLRAVADVEPDAALGNGGLGRLAACFLDSLATLGMPGYGYGINYEYGLFRQEIADGHQREQPDDWRAAVSPWLIERPEERLLIPVYGEVTHIGGPDGEYNPSWLGWRYIVGVPSDMPVVGYGGHTVNVLRLYAARGANEFDMAIFNDGDYVRAVEDKIRWENISKVLYPSDAVAAGRELRLLQEYFFVACALRDIMRRYKRSHADVADFAGKVAIQLNDTHPALTVAELMRMLIDEEDCQWEQAWEITRNTCGYTNHTLLPEALERWPVSLFERVLPRHLQIIYEINRRFLEHVTRVFPGDGPRLARMSLIEEGDEKQLRMAHLAIVGSHAVNGVAALHTELIKSQLVPDFHALWPERFSNKTNGVTQRRWLLHANPGLAQLITSRIGEAWITNLDALRALEPIADDADFQREFMAVKRRNKEQLVPVLRATARVAIDPGSLFDVQAKRIHEYKRQLLAALGIVHSYLRLADDGVAPPVARTHIFAGKAAPGYRAAKHIIKLINNLAAVINHDRRCRDLLRVAFVPDYRVTLAEQIIPAADLSEQISTAGTEASGTGNMKFALNGALTIGTLDGANVEILEEVGAENIYIFGLTTDEVERQRIQGSYRPQACYERDDRVRRVVDALLSNRFCPREPGLFAALAHQLLEHDHYFHLADFGSYLDAQDRVGQEFTDAGLWARKAILNVARIGKFSSDRTIQEYARDIWGLKTV